MLISLLKQKRIRDGLESIVSLSAMAALQLGAFMALARILGASDYGVIVGVAAIVSVTVEFVGLGCGDTLIQTTVLDRHRFHDALGRAFMLVAVTFGPVVAFDIFAYNLFFSDPSQPNYVAYCLIGSELFSARMLALGEHIGIAHRQFRFANFCRVAPQVTRALLIGAAALMHIDGIHQWWILQFSFGLVVPALLMAGAVARFGRPRFHQMDIQWGSQLSFAGTQQLRSVQTNVDRFAAGLVLTSHQLGAYGVAARLVNYSLLPLSSVLRITYPNFFREGQIGGINGTMRYVRRVLPLFLALGLIATAALAILSFQIEAVLGKSFAEAGPFIRLLAMLPVLMAIQYAYADALSGAGRQLTRTIIIGLGVVVIAASASLGAWTKGASGVPVGALFGNLVLAALYVLVARRLARQSSDTHRSQVAPVQAEGA